MLALEEEAKAAGSSDSAARLLSRSFRRASSRSVKTGKARIFMESAVRTAERKLLEQKRVASVSTKDRAEILSEELIQTPGTLLSKQDIAQIYMESVCPEYSVDCDDIPFVDAFRTANSTCNNLRMPKYGSTFSAFRRILPPRYEDGISQLNGFLQSDSDNMFYGGAYSPPYPSARLVSSNIVRDRSVDEPVLTHLVMQWGQYLDHDLDLSAEDSNIVCNVNNCVSSGNCAPIRVPRDDQDFGVGTSRNGTCHPFVRTIAACVEREVGAFSPRQQENEVTSYIDASMVYGSTQERADFLRESSGGRLKVGNKVPSTKPSLPIAPECPPDFPDCCPAGFNSCFVAGDVRTNEQVSLTVMHTLFVREHNRIAAQLSVLNPQWDDERLYQETRLIVGAMVQKISFYDYLPVIFGRAAFNKLLPTYPGYQDSVDATIPNAFATAAYRFGHSLIQPEFHRLDRSFKSIRAGPLSLRYAFMNPIAYEESNGTDPIARGWITQPARKVDEFLNSILTSQLFGGAGLDLAALNIQRGRDHGIPPYAVWKNFCLRHFNISSELANQLTKIRFLQTYGSLDTVDLWVGGLAEENLPGGIVDATFACIMAITFEALRTGDRFWFENQAEDSRVFTAAQLQQIRHATISRIICDNSDRIFRIQPNAFFQGERMLCDKLPEVDLTPWREDPFCYQRVRILRHSQQLNLDFMSSLSDTNNLMNFPLMLGASRRPRFHCIPFTCPTNTKNPAIFAFPTIVNGDDTNFLRCTHTHNSGLPASRSRSPSVYFNRWAINLIASDNGLFSNLGACEAGTTSALTFDCRRSRNSTISGEPSALLSSTEELERELARILQGTATVSDLRPTARRSKAILKRYYPSKHKGLFRPEILRLIERELQPSSMDNFLVHI